MAKLDPCWEREDGYVLRQAHTDDVDAYWEGFSEFDPEGARLTGSKEHYERDEVTSFFLRCANDPDRHDLLLVAPNGRIVGESVINEVDWETRSANFRIALFGSAVRGRGLGTWAVETTRDFAFSELGLHRLELDVFSINPRARHVYEKAGFKVEGVLRDAIWLGDGYCDDILMAILEDEWRELTGPSR